MKTLGYIKDNTKNFRVVYDEKNGTMFIEGTTIATYNLKSEEEALDRVIDFPGFITKEEVNR